VEIIQQEEVKVLDVHCMWYNCSQNH